MDHKWMQDLIKGLSKGDYGTDGLFFTGELAIGGVFYELGMPLIAIIFLLLFFSTLYMVRRDRAEQHDKDMAEIGVKAVEARRKNIRPRIRSNERVEPKKIGNERRPK